MRVRFSRVDEGAAWRWIRAACLVLVSGLLGTAPGSAADSGLSVPGSMVLVGDGKRLAIACERSGEVVTIDVKSGRVRSRMEVGMSLTSLVPLTGDGEPRMLAAVGGANQLVVLSATGKPAELSTYPLHGRPGGLAVSPDGKQVAVALPVLRSVVFLKRSGDKLEGQFIAAVDFAPGRLVFSPNGRNLVVSDGFGGGLAVVSAGDGALKTQVTLSDHNLSGLAFSPDGQRLLLSRQHLSKLARTSFDDLHWGALMRNEIASIDFDGMLGATEKALPRFQRLAVGDVDAGAGDPAAIVVDAGFRVFVALAGVNEIAVLDPGETGERERRIAVGHRPRELLLDEARHRLFVSNSLSDSVSVIDTKTLKVIAEHRLADGLNLTARDRGERLFFDARLSHDGWMSCHSCHTDGHSNGRLADTLGDGHHGSPKRVLSLLGVRDTAPYGWNGSKPDLKSQIESTIATTMHRAEALSDAEMTDLVAFLKSLDAPEVFRPWIVDESTKAIDRGRLLFTDELECNRCHDPEAAYSSADVYDVDLKDEVGNAKFNPPSLRGVGQRASWFHDGRVVSLDKVFSEHSHQLGERQLKGEELADLMAFLRSL